MIKRKNTLFLILCLIVALLIITAITILFSTIKESLTEVNPHSLYYVIFNSMFKDIVDSSVDNMQNLF